MHVLLCSHAAHTWNATGFYLFLCAMRSLTHLYFSHHVVVRLHVNREGLSHLSVTIIQDLDFNKMFILAFLELHILNAERKVSTDWLKRIETETQTRASYPLTGGYNLLQRLQSRPSCAPSPLRVLMCLQSAGWESLLWPPHLWAEVHARCIWSQKNGWWALKTGSYMQ